MARKVWLGNNSKLFWRNTDANGNGTGSFVEIEGCKKISLPQLDSEEIDTSDLSSPNDVKEYQLGDTDPGNSSVDVNFDPTNSVHLALIAALLDKSTKEFRVNISSSGKTCTWKGRIKSFPPEMERNSPVTATMEIRNTGVPTYA